MADIDDQDQQLMLTHQIQNPICTNTVGVTALQFSLQRLSLKWVTFEIIKSMGHPLSERKFPFRHSTDDALGLI